MIMQTKYSCKYAIKANKLPLQDQGFHLQEFWNALHLYGPIVSPEKDEPIKPFCSKVMSDKCETTMSVAYQA